MADPHQFADRMRCPICQRGPFHDMTEFYVHLVEHGAVQPTKVWFSGYKCACGFIGHWLPEMITHFLTAEHDWEKVLVRAAMEEM